MRRVLLATAVILTVATGCDNVVWGGQRISLKKPPPRAGLVAEAAGLEAASQEVEVTPELPTGPILLAGTRTGSQATLVVVGEVQRDALGELPDEDTSPGFRDYFTAQRLAPGSEWVLFSQGARVGRMTAVETGVDDRFCTARPTVSGTVELIPSASEVTRLTALPAEVARSRGYDTYRVHRDDYDQRVASLGLATAAIPRVGAAWPPSVLESRADIRIFQLVRESGRSIAATFVVGDQMSVSPPGPGAYSLFVLGSEAADGYDPCYVWYRHAGSEGKGVPRYFDHLDWDGDGTEEILLDVFGSEHRWFASLARRSGTWVRTSQDSCGRAAAGD